MEYSPPPLFKQGASARAKVVIFSVIAIGLLMVDSHLHSLGLIRQVVGTALYPLQRLAVMPRDALYGIGDYFASKDALQRENQRLKQQQILKAQALQQSQQLSAENAHLRSLLGASERLPVKSLMTEILYDARDAFTRKIVLDRGSRHGVAAGQPVIDDTGVVGQVTRVFPLTAEATLLTDKDQAIPVQVVRSGLRSVAYGRGQAGVLDLRFMATNADIQKGDILVTSGIDGIYPAGLAVAKVAQVENKSTDAFARIVCQPAAGVDRNRQLLILLTDTNLPQRPQAEEFRDRKDRAGRRALREAAKDAKDTKETKDVKDGKEASRAASEVAKPAPQATPEVKDAKGAAKPATTPVPPTPQGNVAPPTPQGNAVPAKPVTVPAQPLAKPQGTAQISERKPTVPQAAAVKQSVSPSVTSTTQVAPKPSEVHP